MLICGDSVQWLLYLQNHGCYCRLFNGDPYNDACSVVTISARSWLQGGLGSITTVSIFSLCNQCNTPSEVKTTTLFLQCVPHPNLPHPNNSQHHHTQNPSLVSMATLSLLLWCFPGSLDHSWELGAYLYVTLAPFNQAKQSLANGELLGMSLLLGMY